MSDSKQPQKLDRLTGALVGAQVSTVNAAQTSTMISGMDALQRAAEGLRAKPEAFRRGDLYEYIECAKYNAEAAARSPSVRAQLTRDHGAPTSPKDVVFNGRGHLSGAVQMKASRDAEALVDMLRDPKYEGMQKLVPVDQVEAVRRRAEELSLRAAARGDVELARQHADTARNVTGELHRGGTASGGTTNDELDFATRHPKLYRLRQETRYVAREGARATAGAAVAGAAVGAVISAVSQGPAVVRGERRLIDAAVQVGRDAFSSGTRSGVNAAAGTVIRYGAARAGVRVLARGNIAVTVASATIDMGVAVLRYGRGEASAAETAEALGQTGTSTLGSIYTGAAAGMVFGPAGVLVGAIAGGLIASSVYQASIAILRSADLSRVEAERIEALCEESIAVWVALRDEVDARAAELVGRREESIIHALAQLDSGLDDPTGARAVEGFTVFAETFGVSLKLTDFDEFDDFMLNSDDPLRF